MKSQKTEIETAKVWITKYLFTSGIFVVDVEIKDKMAVVRSKETLGVLVYYHGEGRDWHRTEASALARCKTLVDSKRKSLALASAKIDAIERAITEGRLPT